MAQDPRLANLLKWSIQNSTPNDPDAATADPQDPSDAQVRLPTSSQPVRSPDAAALQALLSNQPSDAELMKAAMAIVLGPDAPAAAQSPIDAPLNKKSGPADRPSSPPRSAPAGTASLSEKVAALDSLEQLVEGVDNANNLGPLGLWTPLVGLLARPEREIRRMAAWCVGTAVQNNAGAQERAVVAGAVAALARLALEDLGSGPRDGDSGVGGANGASGGSEAGGGEKAAERKAERKKARFAISSLVRNYQPGLDAVSREFEGRGAGRVERVDAGDMESVDALLARLVPL